MRKAFFLLLCAPLIWGLLNCAFPENAASTMKKQKETRRAILLIAFGTSVPEARRAFGEIEKQVREKYRDTEIRWAFTSKTIRTREAANGKKLDSPETALAGLMDDGFTHVAVLSLHIVPGEEFHDLKFNAERFRNMSKGIREIEVARPLLGNYDDMERLIGVLAQKYTPANPDEGAVFIGHGNSRHPSDAIYVALNSLLMDRERRLFTGTVQGHPTPEQLIPKLKSAKIRKVRLIPLMTVAGEHARKDMAGDGAESWKSMLAKNGIESEPVFTGLAEDPDVVMIWLDHLEEAVSKL